MASEAAKRQLAKDLHAALFTPAPRVEGAEAEKHAWAENAMYGSGSGANNGGNGDYDEDDDDAEANAEEEAAYYDGFETSRDFSGASSTALQPREHSLASIDRHVNLGKMNLSQTAKNDVLRGERKQQGQNRHQGRDDRSTTEQVMDPRTRLILFKMLSRGTFEEINGCISTGKEANVYHARTKESKDLAVKVFKTSILVFKDRDKYVSGEHRFRGGYGRSNPRKMVKLWAEKELRNLKRLHTCGIPCPEPHMLRSHVLVMDFIGVDGWPAPRLKDATLSTRRVQSAYVQCLKILRRMYQMAKLVHGDFSEYNLLYLDRTIYVIDVSQSVEMEHPRALEFLRLDIENTNAFFSKKGLQVMHLVHAFQFIVDRSFDCSEEQMDAALDKIQETMNGASALTQEESNELEVSNRVFLNSFIPTSLSQVHDIEREYALVAAGSDTDRLLVHIMTGLDKGPIETSEAADTQADAVVHGGSISEKNGTEADPSNDNENDDQDHESNEDADSGSQEEEEEDEGATGDAFTLKEADKDARKAHKKQVKQEKQERRKTKVPKHIKKRYRKGKA
ncbi:Serine/threonine-protein kinase RIO1 [Hondaea fermentalgiana]|uniref:Serine/threonine-protein kinase RIO1 n=1 Tax=Hondaea fermentalgiana TaxID=2315210 RepID=A0A2R5GM87_9STRA|nr:Serine/threonine-protein kinase RIO1 [Hondaea fermentalgiana]|eukprot:GBG32006.1 Serine/threonine-protein kinase RIO1 [Hondaea fermentalgiana]